MLTPAQIEADQPKGEVVVTFEVEEVARLNCVAKNTDPPYRPVSFETRAGLKDRRSKLCVVLVGNALVNMHNNLGIRDFRGQEIIAKGNVTYHKYPRVTQADGTVKVQPDSYPQYEIVIDDMDYLQFN